MFDLPLIAFKRQKQYYPELSLLLKDKSRLIIIQYMAIVQYLVKHLSGYELLRWGHPPALPVRQEPGVGKEATLVLSVKVHTGQQSSLGPD